jgi:hypothetical protein
MYQTALDAQKQTLNTDKIAKSWENAVSHIWQQGKKDIIINVHEVQMFN